MNPWDHLSGNFNTHKKEDEIDPGAADNILLAWPALFQGIEKIQLSGNNRAALDFGCGTGAFSHALHQRGYKVAAADTSGEMIKIAQAHLKETVAFYEAGHDKAASFKGAPFSLITSVMVFQFIPHIAKAFDDLGEALCPGGVIAFAVFNPDYVHANTGPGRAFETKSTQEQAATVCMRKGDIRIPVYLRDEHEYDQLLKERGYSRLLVRKPRFTRAFLDKYPKQVNTRFSEYIVMVYRKRDGVLTHLRPLAHAGQQRKNAETC